MNGIRFVPGAIDTSACFGNAWELVRRRIWLYVGAAVIAILLIGFIPIVSCFLVGPVMGGFFSIVLRDMKNEPVDLGTLFSGFKKFVPLTLVGLVQSGPTIIVEIYSYLADEMNAIQDPVVADPNFFQPGSLIDLLSTGGTVVTVIFVIVFWLFSTLWYFAVFFAIPLVVDRDSGVGDALKISVEAAFRNFGGLLILHLRGILVLLLGMVLLCLGILVAIPVIYAADVFAYRYVFPSADDGDSPFLQQTPTASLSNGRADG